MTVTGQVVAGVVKIDAHAQPVWMLGLAKREGRRVSITLEDEQEIRGTQANRYWRCVIVPFFQGVWSEGRKAAGLPPYTLDETHSVLVQVLAGSEAGPVPGSVLPVRTRKMTKREFSDLIDAAKAMALHDYNARIPDPGEPWDVSI